MSETTETTITIDTEILRLAIATIMLHALIEGSDPDEEQEYTYKVASALNYADKLLGALAK